MKKWDKLLIISGVMMLSGMLVHFMTSNKNISPLTENQNHQKQDSFQDITHHNHNHNHVHAAQTPYPQMDETEKNTITPNEIHLSAPVSKAKKNIQQSLIGDMQVKITPIGRHEWKDQNKVIIAEKVLVEIKSKENKISSSYYAFINSKNGKIIRTFSAPIFENKNLVGKNIFYID
jgi:hypothetical protein